MKWNWFSPLPPARTGIADYTAAVLPCLARHAEITLWTEQGFWDPGLEKHATVRQLRELPVEAVNGADANIYHLGNAADFHAAIWRISSLHSGVVVLHDLNLQDFFAGLAVRDLAYRGPYLQAMRKHHGREGYEAALAQLGPARDLRAAAEKYPLTAHAVENALGVVVHTPGGLGFFSSQHPKPVTMLPLPYVAGSHMATVTAPRHAFPDPAGGRKVQLVIGGFMGGNRRVGNILAALSSFPLRDQVHLNIFGVPDDTGDLMEKVHSYHLDAAVTIHGYLPDSALDEALSQCDLAFNLRFPTMGESSLSQLRYWVHSLPVLVTPVGWYGTLSEDVVGFVPVETEEASIHHHLHRFIADPAFYRGMGERAHALLRERHSPETYAADLCAFVSQHRPMMQHLMAEKLTARVGARLAGWGVHHPDSALLKSTATKIMSYVRG